MDMTQDPREMTREQLEPLLATLRAMNPNEMSREELRYYNTAMAAMDKLNDPYGD